jgi:hypothetical protein
MTLTDEQVVKPGGLIRRQLRMMPLLVAFFTLAGVAVTVGVVSSIVRFGPTQGYGLAVVMMLGLLLWWAGIGWLARTCLARTAQEIRYSVEGGVVLRTAVKGETVIPPAQVTELRQRLFFPFPGAYSLRHANGVHYLSGGEGFRDFERYLRRENPGVETSGT